MVSLLFSGDFFLCFGLLNFVLFLAQLDYENFI